MKDLKSSLLFLLFCLFLILFSSLPLVSHSLPLTIGSFVEYKVIIHVNNYTEYALEIENVTQVFKNNDSFSFDIWFINLNKSFYYPPGVNYDNLSYPKVFYYIQYAGNKTIYRSVFLNLTVVNDNYFVYKGLQPLGPNVYIIWIVYVNSSGVPSKIVLLQYENGFIVSNTTYILFKSNIINPLEHIYFPSNVTITSGKRVPFYIIPPLFFSPPKRTAIIIGVVVIVGLTVYLTFRRTSANSR